MWRGLWDSKWQEFIIILYIGGGERVVNPLKTSPEYTRAGVYGNCVL